MNKHRGPAQERDCENMPRIPYKVEEFKTGPSPNAATETAKEDMITWLTRQSEEGYVLHSVVAVKTFSGQDGVWAIVKYDPRAANELSATA